MRLGASLLRGLSPSRKKLQRHGGPEGPVPTSSITQGKSIREPIAAAINLSVPRHAQSSTVETNVLTVCVSGSTVPPAPFDTKTLNNSTGRRVPFARIGQACVVGARQRGLTAGVLSGITKPQVGAPCMTADTDAATSCSGISRGSVAHTKGTTENCKSIHALKRGADTCNNLQDVMGTASSTRVLPWPVHGSCPSATDDESLPAKVLPPVSERDDSNTCATGGELLPLRGVCNGRLHGKSTACEPESIPRLTVESGKTEQLPVLETKTVPFQASARRRLSRTLSAATGSVIRRLTPKASNRGSAQTHLTVATPAIPLVSTVHAAAARAPTAQLLPVTSAALAAAATSTDDTYVSRAPPTAAIPASSSCARQKATAALCDPRSPLGLPATPMIASRVMESISEIRCPSALTSSPFLAARAVETAPQSAGESCKVTECEEKETQDSSPYCQHPKECSFVKSTCSDDFRKLETYFQPALSGCLENQSTCEGTNNVPTSLFTCLRSADRCHPSVIVSRPEQVHSGSSRESGRTRPVCVTEHTQKSNSGPGPTSRPRTSKATQEGICSTNESAMEAVAAGQHEVRPIVQDVGSVFARSPDSHSGHSAKEGVGNPPCTLPTSSTPLLSMQIHRPPTSDAADEGMCSANEAVMAAVATGQEDHSPTVQEVNSVPAYSPDSSSADSAEDRVLIPPGSHAKSLRPPSRRQTRQPRTSGATQEGMCSMNKSGVASTGGQDGLMPTVQEVKIVSACTPASDSGSSVKDRALIPPSNSTVSLTTPLRRKTRQSPTADAKQEGLCSMNESVMAAAGADQDGVRATMQGVNTLSACNPPSGSGASAKDRLGDPPCTLPTSSTPLPPKQIRRPPTSDVIAEGMCSTNESVMAAAAAGQDDHRRTVQEVKSVAGCAPDSGSADSAEDRVLIPPGNHTESLAPPYRRQTRHPRTSDTTQEGMCSTNQSGVAAAAAAGQDGVRPTVQDVDGVLACSPDSGSGDSAKDRAVNCRCTQPGSSTSLPPTQTRRPRTSSATQEGMCSTKESVTADGAGQDGLRSTVQEVKILSTCSPISDSVYSTKDRVLIPPSNHTESLSAPRRRKTRQPRTAGAKREGLSSTGESVMAAAGAAHDRVRPTVQGVNSVSACNPASGSGASAKDSVENYFRTHTESLSPLMQPQLHSLRGTQLHRTSSSRPGQQTPSDSNSYTRDRQLPSSLASAQRRSSRCTRICREKISHRRVEAVYVCPEGVELPVLKSLKVTQEVTKKRETLDQKEQEELEATHFRFQDARTTSFRCMAGQSHSDKEPTDGEEPDQESTDGSETGRDKEDDAEGSSTLNGLHTERRTQPYPETEARDSCRAGGGEAEFISENCVAGSDPHEAGSKGTLEHMHGREENAQEKDVRLRTPCVDADEVKHHEKAPLCRLPRSSTRNLLATAPPAHTQGEGDTQRLAEGQDTAHSQSPEATSARVVAGKGLTDPLVDLQNKILTRTNQLFVADEQSVHVSTHAAPVHLLNEKRESPSFVCVLHNHSPSTTEGSPSNTLLAVERRKAAVA